MPKYPSFLEGALEAYHRDRLDAGAADQTSASIRDVSAWAVQKIVAKQYEADVLLPRQGIWRSALDRLATDTPSALETTYYLAGNKQGDPIQSALRWEHEVLDERRELLVRTKTSAQFGAGEWEMHESESRTPELAELRRALMYLHHDSVPEDDRLLGVPKNGRGKHKTFPKNTVLHALGTQALPLAHTITAQVEAAPISSRDRRTILDLRVVRAAWETPAEQTGALQYGAIGEVYDQLASGYADNINPVESPDLPTLDDVRAWLVRTYCVPGVGEDFTKLEAVTDILDQSAQAFGEPEFGYNVVRPS